MSIDTEYSAYKYILSTDTHFKSTVSPIRKWLHAHPVIQNIAIVLWGLLGLGILAEGVQTYSWIMLLIGIVVIFSAYGLKKIIPIFIPPTFNPIRKAFSTQTCRGVSLYYDGNLPILMIPKDVTPRDAGYARGYMMAAHIKELVQKNDFVFYTLKGLPRHIPYLIEKMKEVIPSEYISEMEGLVEGYNAKRETWYLLKGKELTLDNLIYFHMLPDFGHMDFQEGNNWLERKNKDHMGCTVVVDGDEGTGPRAIRTIDWVPMDVYGKYSFVELRETQEDLRFVGHSFPLFVGCLTAMNEHGLCVAMNVTRGLTDYPENTPAVFYLRQMIETCNSVKGEKSAEQFCQTHAPLGPFNLSILDEKDAESVHFYQMDNRTHHIRPWKEFTPLITLNFRYGEQGATNPTFTNSLERKIEIENYYKNLGQQREYDKPDSKQRLMSVLKGQEVNNIRTTSAAYFDPKHRIFKTAFDNGYAADRPLLTIPTKAWFSREI